MEMGDTEILVATEAASSCWCWHAQIHAGISWAMAWTSGACPKETRDAAGAAGRIPTAPAARAGDSTALPRRQEPGDSGGAH